MTAILDIAERFEEHQVEVAAIIARLAHSGQMWDSETFYAAIVLSTVERIEKDERSDFDCLSIGFLMNAINDTELSFDDCVSIGFSDVVLQSLHTLYQRANEEFFEYIMRLDDCPICQFVKLHELKVRLEKSPPGQTMKKYSSAIAALEGYGNYDLEEGNGDRPRIN